MSWFLRDSVKVFLAVILAASLVACGSLSHDIADDGASAGELKWPEPDDTTPLHKGGTTPAIGNLRSIHAGMDKGQISRLIGYPHFSEGRWHVREWDYLFTFHTSEGKKQCLYKVLFDKDYLAQSFYWHPESCAGLINQKKVTTFKLSADALFAFDKAKIKQQGKSKLDELAAKVKQHQSAIDKIRIVGYTDEMGPKGYNSLLSQQRAFAVLSYLEKQGVPAGLMTAVGMGKSNQLKTDCDVNAKRSVRVACMAPNRRVEVQVSSYQ